MSIPITASLVKELRERTGAGMMECKRALQESNGNIEAAVEAMRKSGQAKADKKADRITAEGILLSRISQDGHYGLLLEINSETDFVARDESFLAFANAVADQALSTQAQNLETVLNLKLENGDTIEESRRTLIAKIGENIQIRRFLALTSIHQLANYVHGSRIAALVEYQGGNATVGKDIAMHVVASNPSVVKPSDVPAELINKEKEIFSAQAETSGKPAAIIEKMVEGRIKKFLDEVSLLGQPFLKDQEKAVSSVLTENGMVIHQFIRYAVGEGIEKKVEDFAAEVMAQVKGS